MKRTLTVLIAMLSLAVATVTLAQEPESNAPPAEPKAHSVGIKISTDDEKVIPKEVADKLTSDQLFQLMQTRLQQHEDDVPALAPVIVAIVFGCPVAIVAVILIYRHRKNAMLHRTLAAMIDKGVPIPPELLQPERPDPTPKSDLRRGLTLMGVGAGLIVFFVFESRNAIGIGFIPLLMGVGYLIAWKLEQKKQNGQNQS
ncbi:MAG TPA: DUF6249 domain-containing protein [Verrucomicrobiae bacterium]|nr:DUF6249 domain-containing protein [Verrucomicrobiae bacterium]